MPVRDAALRRTVLPLVVAGLALVLLWWLGQQSQDGVDPRSGLPTVHLDDLPPQAEETVELIESGGPYPHPCCDDTTFHNREGLLPDEPRGYYREYTVETPGLSHRGPRRIVVGDSVEFYWTADHYESFARITLDDGDAS